MVQRESIELEVDDMIKVVHIITDLNSGGAENMLLKFVKNSDRDKFHHEVISLTDKGVLGNKFEDIGIKIHALNLSKKSFFKSLIRAKNICSNFDVVNTWLYHADIFGFIISKILLNKKLIWNIRHSNLNKEFNKSRTLKIVKINSLLSKYVDCITFNSACSKVVHQKKGYKNENYMVIPNGFELDRFFLDHNIRDSLREKFSFTENERILITVGRWDIQKDYYTLLKALYMVKKVNNDFKMLMIGAGLDENNLELMSLIKKYELENHMILLGRRDNVSQLLSCADIYISSSLGESFSNAIGEAMACELFCLVTDVGDSKAIVGETGKVVEPQNATKLSKAIIDSLKYDDISKYGEKARIRVQNEYNIKKVVVCIEDLFLKINDNQ